MPSNYAVLNGGNVVVEFWTGPVTQEELLAHERRHLSDPLIKAGVSVLIEIAKGSRSRCLF